MTTKAGVFNLRTCKLCDDGVVVMGEYGLSNTLLAAGSSPYKFCRYIDVSWTPCCAVMIGA